MFFFLKNSLLFPKHSLNKEMHWSRASCSSTLDYQQNSRLYK